MFTKAIKHCDNHLTFNSRCCDCISSVYGIDPEHYFAEWIDVIGDLLGCGNRPENILAAIKEMISQESRMKKMIASLRKRPLDNIEPCGIIKETSEKL